MPQSQRPDEPGLKYRPEIDGLRAVAIVSVVFSHFGIPGFGGGFVGVDIFLVISGFLITGLITAEISGGAYSIRQFYERRARRILPALFFMLACSTIAAVVILFPLDLREFTRGLLGTIVFASNVEFWRESQNYFEAQRATQPLLHTWSLGVEEQFYILFPLILMGLARTKRALVVGSLALLAMMSFAISCWWVQHTPIDAFYLLPSRFWELMVGALLSAAALSTPSKAASNAGFMIGVGFIAYAVTCFDSTTPFPGTAALLPCLGAALVIWATQNRQCIGKTLLGSRGAVFIGLISYSLYLWHWPLLVFARYISLENPGTGESILLIGLSTVLAVFSWKYVERPFRGAASVISTRRLTIFAAAFTAVFVMAWGAIRQTHGLPERYGPGVRNLLAAAEDPSSLDACFGAVTKNSARALCKIGDASVEPSFVLWGDSHAQALVPALVVVTRGKKISGLFAATPSCELFLRAGDSDCVSSNGVMKGVLDQARLKTVFITANWTVYEHNPGFLENMEAEIKHLRSNSKNVVIVFGVPNLGYPVPEALAKQRLLYPAKEIRLTKAEGLAQVAIVRRQSHHWQKKYGVQIVDLSNALCPDKFCALQNNGQPLYRDGNHLSVFGAEEMAPMFEKFLTPAAGP